MRRKDLGNQAVIKAITVGISAMMALSQPMMVLAEGSVTAPPDQDVAVEAVAASVNDTNADNNPKPGATVSDTDQVSVDEAVNVVKADDNVTSVKEALEEVKQNVLPEPLVEKNEDGTPKKDENSGEAVETDSVLEGQVDTLSGDVTVIKGDVTILDNDVTAIDTAAANEKTGSETFNTTVYGDGTEENKGLAGQVEATVATVENANTEAVTAANNLVANINKAQTIAEANQAYTNAKNKVAALGTAITNAETELSRIEADLTTAQETYKALKEAYDTALAKAVGKDSNDPKKKNDIETAEANLQKAKEDAEALETKAAAAKQEVEKLKTEAENTLASLDSLGNIRAIIYAENDLDDLRDQLQKLDEESADYLEQKDGIEKEIEAKQKAVEELIVKAFIENSDIKGTDVSFTEESFEVTTGYKTDENGNYIKDDKDNYIPIKVTETYRKVVYKVKDEDGNPVELSKLFKVDENGELVEVTAEVVKDEQKVTLYAGKEAEDEIWKTADGKTFEQNNTTYTVDIPEATNGEFVAVDISDESRINSTIAGDDVSQKSTTDVTANTNTNGTKTTTTTTVSYAEITNSRTYTPEYEKYQVETGEYEQLTGPNDKRITIWDLDEVTSLTKQGYDVQVEYVDLEGNKRLYNTKELSWDTILGFLKGLIGIESFSITTTNTIDDINAPIYKDEEGVWITTTANYTETTSVTTRNDYTYTSDDFGYHYGFLNAGWNMGKEDAEKAFAAECKRLENAGYTIDYEKSKPDWALCGGSTGLMPSYYYVISYYTESTTTSSEIKNKVVSKVRYTGDSYTDYTPAVAAEDPIYGTTSHLASTTGGFLKEADLDEKKSTVNDNREWLENAYPDKLAAYDKLVTAAQNAKNEVAETEGYVQNLEDILNRMKSAGINTLDIENKLSAAKDRLEKLKGNKNELDQQVKDAEDDLSRKIDDLTPDPDDDDGDDDGDTPGTEPGDGGDGGSTPGTPAAPSAPAGGRVAAAGGAGAPAAGPAAGNGGVLGARNGRGAGNAAADNGDGDLTTIGDGDTALAGSIEDATGKTADKADDEIKKDDNVKIEDEDPALGSFDDVNEESHTWLWWILALLAGAVTIEEFTRRQLNKKKAAQTSSAKADK